MVIVVERHQPPMQHLHNGSYHGKPDFGIRTTYVVPDSVVEGAGQQFPLTQHPDSVWWYLSDTLDLNVFNLSFIISNNPSFRQKHLGAPQDSDGSDGTWYRQTENYTVPVAQALGYVANLLPLLCTQNAVTNMPYQNDTCVSLFTEAAVML
jgi:hypothetical protein